MNDKQNLNNQHLSAIFIQLKTFWRIRNTRRGILKHSSRRGIKWTRLPPCLRFHRCSFRFRLVLLSLLKRQCGVTRAPPSGGTESCNNSRDSLLPHKQCWEVTTEFNYKIHVIVISYWEKCVVILQILMKMLMITKRVISDFCFHTHPHTDIIDFFHKLQWLL